MLFRSVTLGEVISSQGATVKFRRQFDYITLSEWNSILHFISSFSFTHSYDRLAWKWEVSGFFSVRSIYRILNFRGVCFPNPMIWWQLPLPYKIQIFMWLLARNRILTKHNLCRKGWVGNTSCQFCPDSETTDHLFLKCRLAQHLWFWMGKSQDQFYTWNSVADIITFALSLPKHSQTAFLIMFSALCWTIWKIRNESCFHHTKQKSFRSIVLMVVSLINYWTGAIKKHSRELVVAEWMPQEIETVPLQIWDPNEDCDGNALQLVVYRPSDDGDDAPATSAA